MERLQAGADLGVTSALDLAVLEDIQDRWSSVYTQGGANRAPQVRKGSPLQLARAATVQAEAELHSIEASMAQQAQDALTYQQALDSLSRIGEQLPQQRLQQEDLLKRLARSRELQEQINSQRSSSWTLSRSAVSRPPLQPAALNGGSTAPACSASSVSSASS